MIFLLNLFLIFNLQAAVIKNEVTSLGVTEFDFKEVCEELGVKDPVIITPVNGHSIECLNKKFSLTEFCHKKIPADKPLARGYANKESRKVVCEMASKVMFSLSCDREHIKFCKNAKNGCEKLKKIFAYRLDLAHYSMLEKALNCYFSKPIGDNFNEY